MKARLARLLSIAYREGVSEMSTQDEEKVFEAIRSAVRLGLTEVKIFGLSDQSRKDLHDMGYYVNGSHISW